jgi:hypothetical protein
MLWVWAVGLLAGLIGYVVLARVRRTRRRPAGLAVANTALLTRLPRYAALMRRYRRFVALLGAAALLLLVSGVGLSVRPASSSRAESDRHNRDIELCLDVSGSMEESDVKIAQSLVALAGQLAGQRVGLTIFSDGAVVKFPLTDDASYVGAQLQNAYHKLAASDPAYTAGAFVSYSAGTFVGDGLMTCVHQFDQLGQRRARSIVIATDNATDKGETYTVPQAAATAQREGIRIYAFMPLENGLDLVHGEQDLAQMRSVTAATDGSVYPTDGPSSVSEAAQQILAQEASRLKTPPVLTRTDHPLIPFVAALSAVVLLLLAAWKVER